MLAGRSSVANHRMPIRCAYSMYGIAQRHTATNNATDEWPLLGETSHSAILV